MKKEYRLILLGFLLVTLVDLVGSLTSVKFNFPYSYFLPLSLLIYITIPILNTKQNSLKIGVLSGTLLGLFDSTIGWKISMFLGANKTVTQEQLTNGIWLFIIITNTFLASLIALIVSWLTNVFTKDKSNK